MKYRYRLAVKFRNARNRNWPKKSEQHAVDDLEKLVSGARAGVLAPYWNGAVVTVERSPIGTWEILDGPTELVVGRFPTQIRLSPSLEADGESGVRSENGEELQPRQEDTT